MTPDKRVSAKRRQAGAMGILLACVLGETVSPMIDVIVAMDFGDVETRCLGLAERC